MDRDDASPLSLDEIAVAECIVRGEPATFPASRRGKVSIRAGLIHALLLGRAIPGVAGTTAPMPGVRITGARIEGPLNPADCARPGTGLPILVLEDCDIAGAIDLGAARLARLSLARSRFGFVDLREAYIDGPFDFSGAIRDDDAECWIDARGALINGDVTGVGALLRVRQPRPRPDIADGDRRHAPWLAGSTIHGSIRLIDFAADGGVSLDAAKISGDVRIANALMASQEGDAFRAQSARVDGIILIRGFIANGIVWLLGLRTTGAVQFRDAYIYGEAIGAAEHSDAPDELCGALILGDADIGASVRLTSPINVRGRISFAASKVRGNLEATGVRVDNRTANGRTRALDVTNAEIGANLIADAIEVSGRFDMAGAHIGGKLSFLDARLLNRVSDGTGKALEAINVAVGAEFGREGHATARYPHRRRNRPHRGARRR